MSAHSKPSYITHSMDFPWEKGSPGAQGAGRRVQQLAFALPLTAFLKSLRRRSRNSSTSDMSTDVASLMASEAPLANQGCQNAVSAYYPGSPW